MLFDIDWQGFRQLRDSLPDDIVGIFILPWARCLEQRLRGARRRKRGGDRPADADGAGGNLASDEVRLRDRERPADEAVDEVVCILRAAPAGDGRERAASFVAEMTRADASEAE